MLRPLRSLDLGEREAPAIWRQRRTSRPDLDATGAGAPSPGRCCFSTANLLDLLGELVSEFAHRQCCFANSKTSRAAERRPAEADTMTTIAIIGTGNVGQRARRRGRQGGLRRRVRRPGRRRRPRASPRPPAGPRPRRRARPSPVADIVVLAVPYTAFADGRARRSRRSPPARSSSTRPTRSSPTTRASPRTRTVRRRAARRRSCRTPRSSRRSTRCSRATRRTRQALGFQLDSLFATDDEAAKDAVCGLVGSIGFRPIHVGPLAGVPRARGDGLAQHPAADGQQRQLEHRVRAGRPARGGAHLRPLAAPAGSAVAAPRVAAARPHLTTVTTIAPDDRSRPRADPNRPCRRSTWATARRRCSTTRCGWASSPAGRPDLPRPTRILIVSAHWQTAPMAIGATTTVPLVYDFYGFPQRYYEYEYRSPGAPELAADGQGADARQRAGPRPPDPRPRPRRLGAADGDVPGRRHPGPPAVDAGPRPGAPVRGRPAARAAARRGRADRRVRVHDPRPAVHRRVLRRQAGRAAVVGRVRPLGGRGARRAATSTRCSRSARRRRGCRSRTRPSSTSRRCS